MAATHRTDQEPVFCDEKSWTKEQTQTMLTDSSETQEAAAAKFGEQIIHPDLLKAKERVRK